jgi:hypothetical protein
MVGRKLGVADGRHVALIEHCEGLVGSPLQSVIEVVPRAMVNQAVMVGSVG